MIYFLNLEKNLKFVRCGIFIFNTPSMIFLIFLMW